MCGCGEPAIINKTNRLSTGCADMYCECKSCGHQFVMSSYFSHSLSPSAKTTSELAISLIKALPPQQRHELNQQLSMF
ncbi:transcriptional regulator [Vibrio coralliilyticus]|nr:transcriptional regulator [Vibrio coralliilyticus]